MYSQNSTYDHKVNTLFQKIIPEKTKCVKNREFARAQVLPKQEALKHDYLIVNPSNSVEVIIIDIDKENYPYDIYPSPNFVVSNKTDSKAHAYYFLETPIHANHNSSKKAQGYYNATHRALIKQVGGDPLYNHTFSKNPLSAKFRTTIIHDKPYSLDHICEYVNPINKTIIKPHEAVALGRNCFVFEEVSKWSYHVFRSYHDKGYDAFHRLILKQCETLNWTLTLPLCPNEIKGIAKSISAWVWKEFSMEKFSNIQSNRAKRLGVVRRDNMAIKQAEALRLLGQGLTISEIARTMNVTRATVYSWLDSYEI